MIRQAQISPDVLFNSKCNFLCEATKKKWNMQNKIYFCNSDIAFLLL